MVIKFKKFYGIWGFATAFRQLDNWSYSEPTESSWQTHTLPFQLNVTNIVTHRPIARQRPQYTRGQQYRSSVFCVPRTDRCYAKHVKHILAYAVTSQQ
jgi:peptide methionine sulfoxide reductase MsrA